MRTRTGIFGGSFNPIHMGHVSLARQLLVQARLDEVWLMVSPQNPLKSHDDLLSDELRLQMVSMATEKETGLVASDYEFHLPRPSYTWTTLQHLQCDYAQREFTLIIGGDNWQLFPRWYHADDIIRHFPIAIYPREGSPIDRTTLPMGVTLYDTRLLPVSSTEIRQRVARGESIRGLVPEVIEPMVLSAYGQMAR